MSRNIGVRKLIADRREVDRLKAVISRYVTLPSKR